MEVRGSISGPHTPPAPMPELSDEDVRRVVLALFELVNHGSSLICEVDTVLTLSKDHPLTGPMSTARDRFAKAWNTAIELVGLTGGAPSAGQGSNGG